MIQRLLWLLVLILRNHLLDPTGQTPPQGFRYASYEVIVPKKLTPRHGQQAPQDVNYWLQIEGKGQVVQLKQKKGIIPKQFPVFTYNKEGNLQVDYPFIRDDCYYQGFVRDKPFSLVALSTCSRGLRGILRLDNMTYEVQPIQPSATFQHVVYRLEEKEDAVPMRCGLTEEERRRQEAMIHSRKNTESKIHSREGWWPHIRYVKNAVVVDHERYVQFDRNETLVAMRVMEIINLANSFYVPLAVELSLIGLVIWTHKDFIDTSGTINVILSDFSIWRRDVLLKHIPNDVGHLLVYKSFGTTHGLAFIGKICSDEYASAVETYMSSSMFYVSNTFAHELGHVLGMVHDEEYCKCANRACIMAAYQANTDQFSNCSYADYFKHRDTSCMFVPPDPDKIYIHKYCGNKIVEEEEQCDCGSKQECDSNPCCQSNCMLRPGATCALGKCCDKCSYLPAGTVCRKEISTCDLPEYCNGTSEWCPQDFYVQNGAPCKEGTYCFNGRCNTHHDQCQEIFGRKAIVASEDCFRKLNLQGDRFGNCGLRHGIYMRCSSQNILCGRIQCDKVDHLLLGDHTTVIQTPIDKMRCWGTDFHSGMNLTDSGAVKDGTPCGTDMMCINKECKSVSSLNYDCNAAKCHNQGRCNNLKHCHCDFGWAPPDCQKEGNGGSIDSGPPPGNPVSDDSGGGSSTRGERGGICRDRHRCIMLGISIFYLSLLCILVAGVPVYYRNELKEGMGTKLKSERSSQLKVEQTLEEGLHSERSSDLSQILRSSEGEQTDLDETDDYEGYSELEGEQTKDETDNEGYSELEGEQTKDETDNEGYSELEGEQTKDETDDNEGSSEFKGEQTTEKTDDNEGFSEFKGEQTKKE